MQKLNLNKKEIICIAVYALLAIDLLIMVPLQIRAVVRNNISLHKVNVQIREYTRDSAAGEKFLKEKENLSRDILFFKGKILSRQEVSSLSAYVSSKAKDNNVDIIEISAGTQEKYKTSGQHTYYYLPLKIDAESGYHDLGCFLNALNYGAYYFNSEEILIQGTPSYHKIRMTISTLLKE